MDRGTLIQFEVASGLKAFFRWMLAFIALFMQVETVLRSASNLCLQPGASSRGYFLDVEGDFDGHALADVLTFRPEKQPSMSMN